jgi:UDP-3-O-[3-hydroxymyristoyl] glucosamine N-acyltransferase
MKVSVREIAALVNGEVLGDLAGIVTHPSRIEEATPGSLCFLADAKYYDYAQNTQATALLVDKLFKAPDGLKAALIVVEDVRAALNTLLNAFGRMYEKPLEKTDLSRCFFHETASMGTNVFLAPFCCVGEGSIIGNNTQVLSQVYIGKNCSIGQDCVLHPGVRLMDDCKVGDRCVIHPNTVIGSDGFGFLPNNEGVYSKIPHLGNVEIGNDVEIGANCAIDRAVMGSTVIEDGVKLDNLIQVAHNVRIGKNTVIAAQAGIAGSTRIGANCLIGGQSGFVGHLEIADGTKVQAQSGVTKSVKKPNTALYGSPAIDYNNYIKSYALFKQLPDLMRKK